MICTNAILEIGAAEIKLDGTDLSVTTVEGDHIEGHWRLNTAVIQLSPADRFRVETALIRVIERREEKATARADKHRGRTKRFRQSSGGRG